MYARWWRDMTMTAKVNNYNNTKDLNYATDFLVLVFIEAIDGFANPAKPSLYPEFSFYISRIKGGSRGTFMRSFEYLTPSLLTCTLVNLVFIEAIARVTREGCYMYTNQVSLKREYLDLR